MVRFTPAVAIIGLACISSPLFVSSFQTARPPILSASSSFGVPDAPTPNNNNVRSTTTRLFESSAASEWMENEKRFEEEMDEAAATSSSSSSATAVADSTQDTTSTSSSSSTKKSNNNNEYDYDNTIDTTPHLDPSSRWEELHGNYILRPPNNDTPPRALIHFLGGALLGAAPQLSYRYMLERLSSRGYLIVATPYQLSFDHLATCDEVIGKFELVAPDLAKQYGAVPVVGVGHSCGSLLHMLITSLFPDTPRAANALISYNNRGVSEAVPLFEELIVPLFSDKDRNGSDLMKAMIGVAREKYNGKVPSDDALLKLLQSIPTPIPGMAELTSSILTPSLVTIPKPVRESLTNIITEPTYEALSNAGIPSLLLSSLDITQQIPKLIDEVEEGARDFVPIPEAMSSAARRAYRCRRTLLLQFENDNLDDSEILEGYLKEAESVMKMKRPMITIDLQRKVLDGNHLTPLLGPSGGESWGEVLEDTLGGVFETVDGIVSGGGGGSANDDNDDAVSVDSDDGTATTSKSAKAVRERLGYQQVERVVDELVAWLDEGSL